MFLHLSRSAVTEAVSYRAAARLRVMKSTSGWYTLCKKSWSSSPAQPSNVVRLSQKIIDDHGDILRLSQKILTAPDHIAKTEYQNQFVWETARHAIAEELVVFPAFEKYLTDGKSRAEKDREQTAVLKRELYDFQRLAPTDVNFESSIRQLYSDLEQHFMEEEREDFPRLEQAVGEAESRRLANSFQRTKLFVPTRSHPSSPDKPPFETAASLLMAPIDKIGDIFRKFPEDR